MDKHAYKAFMGSEYREEDEYGIIGDIDSRLEMHHLTAWNLKCIQLL
jgi:hypothetical protein